MTFAVNTYAMWGFPYIGKMLSCCSKPSNDFRLAEPQYSPSMPFKLQTGNPSRKCYVSFIRAFYLIKHRIENVSYIQVFKYQIVRLNTTTYNKELAKDYTKCEVIFVCIIK